MEGWPGFKCSSTDSVSMEGGTKTEKKEKKKEERLLFCELSWLLLARVSGFLSGPVRLFCF